MVEGEGEPDSETRITVLERGEHWWRYALAPRTGRKHQLRVHMAALGAPIANDRWYPVLCDRQSDTDAQPLQLLARSLAFVDPPDGRDRKSVVKGKRVSVRVDLVGCVIINKKK